MIHIYYERNSFKENKIYHAILSEKYINYNGDGDSYVFKLRFKRNNDSINDETIVGEERYNLYEVNDTLEIYYNPSSSTSRIYFPNTRNSFNKSVIIFMSILAIFILFCVYKIRTVSNEELIE
jgi:hypothetical protein